MGEIFEAFLVLNQTLKLGLTNEQLMRAEGSYKSAWAKRINLPKEFLADENKLGDQFEFKAQLVQRRQPVDVQTRLRLGADLARKTAVELQQTMQLQNTLKQELQQKGLMQKNLQQKNFSR